MANDLVQARAYYDRGAWDEAFEGLRLADEAAPLSCDDLQRLGFAAYLIGGEIEFERCFDRLHRAQNPLDAWQEDVAVLDAIDILDQSLRACDPGIRLRELAAKQER